MKKVFEILNNIIIFFLILLIIFVINSKYIRRDQIVNIFGKSFLVVTTGSMKPEINPCDLIIISREKNYKINDIVTYIDDGICITHRIIKIDDEGIICKGDANNLEDGHIEMNTIQGKVIFKSKILGLFALYMLKPITVIYFIILIVHTIFILIKNEEGEIIDENSK